MTLSWPIKILKKIKRFYPMKVIDLLIQQESILIIALLAFYALNSEGQYLWFAIIFLANLFHLVNYKKDNLNVVNSKLIE